MTRTTPPNLIGIAPYLVVRNLAASLDYYCQALGFERPRLWGEPPTFAMPHRDGLILMLNQANEGVEIIPCRQRGGYWDAYIWVRDAEALYQEFSEKGAVFEYPLTLQKEYGNKEFAIVDPDGHLIAFGQNVEG